MASDHTGPVCGPCRLRSYGTPLTPPQVPQSFWEDRDVQSALRARHMGHVIRAYRLHSWHGRQPITQSDVAAWADKDQAQLSRIETGPPIADLNRLVEWATLLGIPQSYLWFDLPRGEGVSEPRTESVRLPGGASAEGHIEDVRQRLHELFMRGAASEASLDDWEQTVVRYGAATRERPARVLLRDLLVDLDELWQALDACRLASHARRLTRTIAQMSGLVVLMLVKLDGRHAFRRWARTARVAAAEAGDTSTHAWVLAQEAYGHYYGGDLDEAIKVAQHARAVAGRTTCVGVPLASSLEARAHALRGDHNQTRATLDRAETATSQFTGDALAASAFGYNEAQLRFHEGNAYTHLRDTTAAMQAQDRAFGLCAPGDYTDWAMTKLDRATCLLFEGDPSAAVAMAVDTVASLSGEQRRGIIAGRGRQIIHLLPTRHRARPAVRELEDLLIVPTDTDAP